jgi:hypothetical protein
LRGLTVLSGLGGDEDFYGDGHVRCSLRATNAQKSYFFNVVKILRHRWCCWKNKRCADCISTSPRSQC